MSSDGSAESWSIPRDFSAGKYNRNGGTGGRMLWKVMRSSHAFSPYELYSFLIKRSRWLAGNGSGPHGAPGCWAHQPLVLSYVLFSSPLSNVHSLPFDENSKDVFLHNAPSLSFSPLHRFLCG